MEERVTILISRAYFTNKNLKYGEIINFELNLLNT